MKSSLCTTLVALAQILSTARAAERHKDHPAKPVPATDVHISDAFWSRRIETNRKVTVPLSFRRCEETGRIDNFAIAGGLKKGSYKGAHFNDSDVYKVVEGAAYTLAARPDPELDGYLDDVIAKIAAAQQPDGYLDTYFTIARQDQRFRHIHPRPRHELYCMGHLIEAGAAHHEMTGKRNLLTVARKLADHIDSVFGPGRLTRVPEHQQLELALVRLYRVTGEERYLKLAGFFIDQRGNAEGHRLYGAYSQDHMAVRRQSEIVGHAVRAMYNCVGMADLHGATGDKELLAACRRLWESTTARKMYVTGGVGARHRGEAFGKDYELPNMSAYSETCAAIGLVFFAHRMLLIEPDADYADVLERALYNGVLGGVSIEGDTFFYVNRLADNGRGRGSVRSKWFGCACCPVNVCRFIPSVPGYVYARGRDGIYVNLFVGGTGTIKLDGRTVGLTQETDYPWDGLVKITVDPGDPATFTVLVRVPGWAREAPVPSDLYRYMKKSGRKVTVKVNGAAAGLDMDKGFARIRRTWRKGDVIELDLPMPVRRVLAHPKVTHCAGKIALERGPIVYCAEWKDNGGKALDIVLPDDVELRAEHRKDMLGGVTVIKGRLGDGEPFLAIPYYARSHRGRGEMAVWLKRTIQPVSASYCLQSDTVEAIADGLTGKSSADLSVPRLTWWDHKGSTEWVQRNFGKPREVSAVEVYWFADHPKGGCRVPASWRVLYRSGTKWAEVTGAGAYGVAKDRFNKVEFDAVTTSALRLEVKLQPGFSGGIVEWRVPGGH